MFVVISICCLAFFLQHGQHAKHRANPFLNDLQENNFTQVKSYSFVRFILAYSLLDMNENEIILLILKLGCGIDLLRGPC